MNYKNQNITYFFLNRRMKNKINKLLIPYMFITNNVYYIFSFGFFFRWLKTVLESAGWWWHPSLPSVIPQATPQPCLQPTTCPPTWPTIRISFITRTRLTTHLLLDLETCRLSFFLSITFPRQYMASKVSRLLLAPGAAEIVYNT